MTLEWDDATRKLVVSERVARLATADERGEPSLIPICYVFDGRDFYTPVDEKPKNVSWGRLKRLRNIEVNPQVALLIDIYDEDWSQLSYVLIRGLAEIVRPRGRFATDHARALTLLREKYPQYRTMALEGRPLIRIVPARIRHWTASSV